MGANRRLFFAVAGAAAIVLGSAGAGYGVYDAWQQEQRETSMSDPRTSEDEAGGSSTLRSSPATGERTTTPTPEPTPTATDRERPEQSEQPPSSTPKPDRSVEPERSEEPQPNPTPTSESSEEDESEPEPSPEATAASTEESRFAAEVVRLTNVERQSAGCEPLRTDASLTEAATAHSSDMAERDYFDHNSPDGTTPWKRMLRAGYEQPAAENIAKGQTDPAAVVAAWMDSEGHRQNMLNCSYEAIGVGVELDEGPYWTQNFGFE